MTEAEWIRQAGDLAERSADPVLLAASGEEDRRRLALGIDDLVDSARAQAWGVDADDIEALAELVDRLEDARRALHRPPGPRGRWWRPRRG